MDQGQTVVRQIEILFGEHGQSKGTVISSELSISDGMWVHYGLWKSQLHIWKATMPKDIHWF